MEETKDNNISKSLLKNDKKNPIKEFNNQKIFEDNPFTVHNTFYMREHHDSDFISSLAFSSEFVCAGTMTGSIFKFNSLGTVEKLTSKHTSKITSIIIEDNSVIISAWEKGIIHIQSLK